MENEPLSQNIEISPLGSKPSLEENQAASEKSENKLADKPNKNKHLGWWIGLAILASLIVLGFVFKDSILPASDQPLEPTKDVAAVEGVDSQIVAVVNGDSITRESFNIRFGVVSGTLGSEPDLESESNVQLKAQVIDDLVNSKLLLQAATIAGVTVSAEETEAQFQQLIDQAGGLEALQIQMDLNKISLDFVRQDLTEQGIIQKYLGQRTSIEDLSSTEEEIIVFYDNVRANSPDIPPLDEVRTQIESTLVSQKTNDAITGYIEVLRQAAEIEILF